MIKGLLEKHQPEAALAGLETLGGDGLSADRRGLLLSATGAAHLMAGRPDAALPFLRDALLLKPDHVPAGINLAGALTRLGNTNEARERAKALVANSPASPEAWAALLDFTDEPVDAVPPELVNNPTVQVALAARELAQEEWDPGLDRIRRVGLDDPRNLILTAEGLITAAEAGGHDRTGLLRRASDALSRLRTLVPSFEAEIGRHATAVLADVRTHLGDTEEATELYASLIEAGALDEAYVARASMWMLDHGRPQLALDALARSSRDDTLAQGLLARAHAAIGDLKASKSALSQGEALLAEAPTRQEVIAMSLAALTVGDGQAASRILGLTSESDVRLEVLRARCERLLGNHDGATDHYYAALSSAESEDNVGVRLEFAQHLYISGNSHDALSALAPIAATEEDERVISLFAELSYNVGDLATAERLTAAFTVGDAPPWAVRLRAYIALRRRDLASASKWLRRWVDADEAAAAPLLWLAEVEASLGANDEAERRLAQVGLIEGASAEVLMQAAALYHRLHRGRPAVDLAYRALRADHRNGAIQAAYFQIVAQRGDADLEATPEIVASGTGITVAYDTGQEEEYFVVAGEPDSTFGEISIENTMVAHFLGKPVGAASTFAGIGTAQREARLVGIAGPLGYAWRWVARQLQRSDPTQETFAAVPIGDEEDEDKFETLFEVLKAKRARTDGILKAYVDASLPIGFVAVARRSTVAQAYFTIVEQAPHGLLVEEVDPQGAIQVANSDSIVLTRAGLVTIHQLGARDLLAKRRLIVVPGLLEELQREEHELRSIAERGRTAMGWKDDAPTMDIVQPGDAAHLLADHEELLAWVRRQELAPRPLSWEARNSEAMRAIGAEAFDVCLIAEEMGLPIHVDDLGLRRLARSEFGGVAGFSTYALVRAARERGELDESRFNALLEQLLMLRHVPLPVPVGVLRGELSSSDAAVTPKLTRLLGHLGGPWIALPVAAALTARLLREIALDDGRASQLPAVAEAFFEALFNGRPLDQVEQTLELAFAEAFNYLPLHGRRLLELLAAYRRGRANGGLILP